MKTRKNQFLSVPPLIIKTKCEQLIAFLRHELETNYKPGDKLPPDTEFAMQLGVNKITLAKALLQLKTEGYISRKTGAGTVVLPRPRQVWNIITAVSFRDAATTSDPYYHNLFGEMNNKCIQAGFMHSVVNVSGEKKLRIDLACLDGILHRPKVAGVLVAGIKTEEYKHLRRYQSVFPPVVWAGVSLAELGHLNWINVDHYAATQLLIRTAMQFGYRRLFFVSKELNSLHRQERYRAFISLQSEKDVFIGPAGVNALQAGRLAWEQIQRLKVLPDALLVTDCRSVEGIYCAWQGARGQKDRLPIFTFDYDVHHHQFPEVVASVVQPLAEMAMAVVEFFKQPVQPFQKQFEAKVVVAQRQRKELSNVV